MLSLFLNQSAPLSTDELKELQQSLARPTALTLHLTCAMVCPLVLVHEALGFVGCLARSEDRSPNGRVVLVGAGLRELTKSRHVVVDRLLPGMHELRS